MRLANTAALTVPAERAMVLVWLDSAAIGCFH
jgi:hypothetical protein